MFERRTLHRPCLSVAWCCLVVLLAPSVALSRTSEQAAPITAEPDAQDSLRQRHRVRVRDAPGQGSRDPDARTLCRQFLGDLRPHRDHE
jgi:hypothetical protein